MTKAAILSLLDAVRNEPGNKGACVVLVDQKVASMRFIVGHRPTREQELLGYLQADCTPVGIVGWGQEGSPFSIPFAPKDQWSCAVLDLFISRMKMLGVEGY